MTDTMRVPAGGRPTWRVVSQQETTEVQPNGGVERGWRITYTVNGTTGSVFVPASRYNRANVAAAVAAAAAETAAIANLTG